MTFIKTDLSNGDIAFTLTLTSEDVKRKYSYVTQMLLRNGLIEGTASWMPLGLEAMAREIQEEAENVRNTPVEYSG